MGKNYPKKYYHELQEKVLEYIIKNHPDKIREIEYQSTVVISKNKLYPKERGSHLLSNGYYMETKSPPGQNDEKVSPLVEINWCQ
jgi:hypothetical protein